MKLVTALALVVGILTAASVFAAEPMGRESLVDLPGVVVDIVQVADSLRASVPDGDLRTRIENRLKAGRVPLLTATEAAKIVRAEKNPLFRRYAVVSLMANGLQVSDETFVHLNLRVDQTTWVAQKGDMARIISTTWETNRYGAYHAGDLERGDLLQSVDAVVDELITAWQTTHPEAIPAQAVKGE